MLIHRIGNTIARYWSQSHWMRMAVWLLIIFGLFKVSVVAIPLPRHELFRPTSTLVFDCNAKLLRAFTAPDDKWRIQTKLKQISPQIRKFQIAYEDHWFYWHSGVNPVALLRASYQNWRCGRIVSGGSTLTMQIARMMEPKSRNYFNKVLEVLRAIQLEGRYSKRELLEIYFNIAPYGGNIEGVAAASWLYFGKEPDQLSCGEAALLVALPNNPSGLRPDLHPEEARRARDKVLQIVYQQRLISKREYLEALAEAVLDCRTKLPFEAAHFCRDVYSRDPSASRIYSTLNLHTQLLVRELLEQHIAGLRGEGITNGAVVILDNKTHELVAAVGSAEFFNENDAGQVNGYLAPRSPGSALKPFVYTLGFENGWLSPQHYLEDVPIDFRGGYSPENFDGKFNGIISAKEALGRSLNVPAVNALQMLGPDNGLYQLLRKANLSTITTEDRYGLSIILGGCEVNLLELTALYSTFASNGIFQYPKMIKGQTDAHKIRLFSPGAIYLTTQILSEIRRPDLPACWEFTSLPEIAWKTGTSYGHRDAWSIGYNPQYTIGVWIGNFSGEGRAGLIGAEAAAPLLFNIFNRLSSGDVSWFKQPASVSERKVCALSGYIPGKYCTSLVSELYLPDRSSEQDCPLHQSYMVDTKTGYRLPPHYYAVGNTIEKEYIKWPPRVAAWLEGNGFPVERIPTVLPEWQQLLPGQAPVIRSPSVDYKYQIREGIALDYQKICLEAAAANDAHKLYWFVDGKLAGTAISGQKLFIVPKVGSHNVVCQDDQGRSTEVQLTVSN